MAPNPQRGPGGAPRQPGKHPGGGAPRPPGGPREGGGRRDGGGGPREGGGGPRAELPALPRPNAPRYFADGPGGAIRRDLLEGRADALARSCAAVPAAQLRAFLEDVRDIGRRAPPDEDPDPAAIQAQMALLKAKAALAFRRRGKAENFPHELLQFFVDHAAGVQDARDLAAFRRILEAVAAYHRFYERKA
jgi:CRISPR type III-A-associated protein Csm2